MNRHPEDINNRDPYQEAEKLRKAIKEADYIDIPTKEVLIFQHIELSIPFRE